MKTITCKQMGGPCDLAITADTSKEMIDKGIEHVKQYHPDIAQNMDNNSQEEKDVWYDSFMTTWEKTPNV
jgi:predicted small metal-binding protein